ncbi:MAG TPA: hypothetical protein PL078_08005 [Bacillota bacterium]|jgi:hypothetical protein|nr:hypothetical protein [Peptococcaceae bacterium MAG4]NLW38625.1 hypothetical protein [Peptococcaceae bacterium]HPZ43935.1 hypothetical protein [Bacillota bacterium]HQD76423.1 hypothetical protein [Bacillota bacterium]HUM59137.1 hypothetical protein [Bacillota bacterium]
MFGRFRWRKRISLIEEGERKMDLLVEEPAKPRIKRLFRGIKSTLLEASVNSIKSGLVAFFETISNNIKNGLK